MTEKLSKDHQFVPDADGPHQVDSCIYCGETRAEHAETVVRTSNPETKDSVVVALRGLARHLRYCRQCGEMDAETCEEGWKLWLAVMPEGDGHVDD